MRGYHQISNNRPFHSSSILFRAWGQSDDKKLLDRYNRYGPSWTFLSFTIPHRTPDECRKRILHLTGRISSSLNLHPKDREKMFHHAMEFEPNENNSSDNSSSSNGISDGDGGLKVKGKWHSYPPTPISPSPYLILASKIRKKTMKERWNPQWTQMEIWALREGYDQWGDNWTKIAYRIPRRTPAQCRKFMEKRYRGLLRQQD